MRRKAHCMRCRVVLAWLVELLSALITGQAVCYLRPASGIDRSASWCRLPSGGAPSARSIPTGEALTSRRLPERPRGRATWSLPSGVVKELAVPRAGARRPTDYVFCARPAGRCGSTGSASRVAACDLGASLPGLRIHDLRHTAVALWLAEARAVWT
jgi:hypothetical protein